MIRSTCFKKVMAAILCLLLVVSFAACGGQNVQGTPSNAQDSKAPADAGNGGQASGEKVTVTFTSDVYNVQDWDKMAESFSKKYPNITLKYEQLPVDEPAKGDKVKTMFATNTEPDIVEFAGPELVPNFQNQLIVLDDYIAKDKEFSVDSLYPGSIDFLKQFVADGKIHSLPGQVSPGGMIYNKTLFDKFKVPYPTNDMTWEQAVDLAKKITREEDGQKYYGLWFSNFDSNYEATLFAMQEGLTDMNTDIKKINLDDERFKKIYDFYQKTMTDPTVTVSYNEYVGGKMSFDQFNQGNVGMWPENLWTVSNLRMLQKRGEAKFEWGIVNVPHFSWGQNQGLRPVLQPTCITTACKNPDAAWTVMKWYFAKDTQSARAKDLGIIPSTVDADAMAAFKEGTPGLNVYDTVIKQPYGNTHINIDANTVGYETQYATEAVKIMDRYLMGNLSVDDTLKQKKELAQKIIDSMK